MGMATVTVTDAVVLPSELLALSVKVVVLVTWTVVDENRLTSPLPLSDSEVVSLNCVYRAFFTQGPALTYNYGSECRNPGQLGYRGGLVSIKFVLFEAEVRGTILDSAEKVPIADFANAHTRWNGNATSIQGDEERPAPTGGGARGIRDRVGERHAFTTLTSCHRECASSATAGPRS